MMNKLLITSTCLFLICSCSISQNAIKSGVICNGKVKVGFSIPKEGEEARKYKVKDTTLALIEITFGSGFDDSLTIYINDKIIESGYAKTNPTTSLASFGTNYYYSSEGESTILMRVFNNTENVCFETQIKKGWRYLHISFYQNEWIVNYSNHQAIFE